MAVKIIDEFTGIGTPKQRHYWRNRQKVIDASTEFRKADSVRYQGYMRTAYKKHKDKIIERTSQYSLDHPNQQMVNRARRRAKEKKLPFGITVEDIIVPEFCPILGVQLRRHTGSKGATSNSPSLDRIVPELGYVKGNVRVISHRANTCKSNLSRDQIQRLLDYVDGKI